MAMVSALVGTNLQGVLGASWPAPQSPSSPCQGAQPRERHAAGRHGGGGATCSPPAAVRRIHAAGLLLLQAGAAAAPHPALA